MPKKKIQKSFKNAVFESKMFKKFENDVILDKKEIAGHSSESKDPTFNPCGSQGHSSVGSEVGKSINIIEFTHRNDDSSKIETKKTDEGNKHKNNKNGRVGEENSISINIKQRRAITKCLVLRLPRNFAFENLKVKISTPPFMHETEDKEEENSKEDKADNRIDKQIESRLVQIKDRERSDLKSIDLAHVMQESTEEGEVKDASVLLQKKNVTIGRCYC
ncbi:uncharacterized protein VICG_00327 [Vittaforma corneae ATCC 50505]|uniref:Uncharacterized protein n=1 Tax=Vittaforma corneae (strain ATCC 50505) TaxID=993615 RepID=L2GQ03_VITCO|nr:uncharacterized protein VICG_00327 [Vittaforma corneae ATCC 50505]ELA42575.1 hypothetical protein VICG_00327 [Vittaforma corneae ATCC 50505]